MARSAEILGDRWSLLILREAFYGVARYDDMLADLGAPRSTLTDRLAKLVEEGLLTRRPYQEPGSRTRYAYVLTAKGSALGYALIAISKWGEDHVLGGPAPVEFVDQATQSPVRLALLDEQDRAVELSQVRMKLRDVE